ncbi:glucodextranase DOMON-like domain-containing protein [Pengzhenrongella phosphoraccumulans]|uniref:glucodextranase DOMON-like domain-containing protein n=1 Tax=Pengzhenrongella phosphoraccumulans TaxID=3114394 RepID=UPI0038901448
MRTGRRILTIAAAASLVVTALGVVPAQGTTPAPDGPGAMSHFDLARKDCLGTARNSTSKVWFTVANGVLSDVYYPTVDTTNVETLQYVVTDGSSFTDLQTRDMTYTVSALDDSGMACRVTSTAKSGRYTLTTDYFTDPQRASVVMRTRLKAAKGSDDLKLYARFDATVNGNGGGLDSTGGGNAGADDAVVDTSTGGPVPVSIDVSTATTAANRDYATPVYAALRADRKFLAVSSGFAGTASDGLNQLDTQRSLSTSFATATQGNVVQTAQLDVHGGRAATLALGFGSTQGGAVATAGRSAAADAGDLLAKYQAGWRAYDAGLNRPATGPALSSQERRQVAQTYYLSANVLKASEDKTFPGAIVASLASPWGQAVAAGDPAQTYFGSYREVFARDLYETFTGLVAAGDLATARSTVKFLFERQQQADGSMPRNSLINGKLAPDSFGVQLDEVAYPILMARTVGLTDKAFYLAHLKRAADFIVAHGPAFGSERWEEQAGYSPSTIAAEIAGLTAAGAIAEKNGDAAGARIYRATADHYQRMVKTWTVTTNGSLSAAPYFIRLSKTGDPNAASTYNLGNGGPDADQRSVVDAGFLELPRLGILPSTDPAVVASLLVVDQSIKGTTASGDGFYRYGTTAPGTEDGYGDCNTTDSTDCTVQGKPWAGVCAAQSQNKGSGHLWPALSGERGEHQVATGDKAGAVALWKGMAATASGIGLIPEQVWENAAVAASPFGTAPECASIGFQNGKAAGSAAPLTWSAAQFVRLSANISAGRITEQPKDTTERYLRHTQAATTVTLTSPADNSVTTGDVTVAGTTAAGATVDVDAVNIDINGDALVTTTTAGPDGAFAVTLTPPPGTATLTVTATAPGGATGFAQRTVVNDVVPGTQLFTAADPAGDDNGPGTYVYPTSGDFKPGAYDLRSFEVYDSGPDSVTFRVQTADLTPTFGSPLGAQLIDVYLHNPAAGATSTAASFPGRNYVIEPGSAWNRLIEVQGFGQRFVNAAGTTVGSVAIRAAAATRYITFTVSKAALGGTPAAGWSMAVVLTGQDGFSSDQARGFQTQAEGYQFGVCATPAPAGNPICGLAPGSVPKAMDILTPAGISQADELNPVGGTVSIRGVILP